VIYLWLVGGKYGLNPSEKYERQLGRIIPYIVEKMFESTNQLFIYVYIYIYIYTYIYIYNEFYSPLTVLNVMK